MVALKWCLTLLLWLSITLPAMGWTTEVALSAEVTQRLAVAAQQVETLHSDFVQEKYLSIFEEKLISTGQFYYQKPDQLRWELLEPVGSGFVITGDSGQRWHERIDGSESFKLDQDPAMALIAEQLFAWAKADLAWIKQNYTISVVSEQPIQLKLVPLEAAAQFLSHLMITFNDSDRYVVAVEIHESDGDSTRINFNNSVVNSEINDAIFSDRCLK
ncbi:MAG: hypothetical protein B6I37_00725 [Desulfobacteraceae bacterium 4572_35.2]|nr:MAG: hypothetical protein B6I37_00725 [Desulfobacteraceae bacterium 4572_35.2]